MTGSYEDLNQIVKCYDEVTDEDISYLEEAPRSKPLPPDVPSIDPLDIDPKVETRPDRASPDDQTKMLIRNLAEKLKNTLDSLKDTP
jgi:hypothetical protein